MIRSQFYSSLFPVCMVACLLTGLNTVPAAVKSDQPAEVQQTQAAETNSDESAIREAANAFMKAFNAGDAAAIAAQWIEGGEYANSHDQRFVGRAAIQDEYEKFFKQFPGVEIQVKIDSVRLLTPELAIEEGTASLGAPGVYSPVGSRYLMMHVKQNGKWAIAAARDVRVEAQSTQGYLSELDGLVGTWNFEKGATVVKTKCRWIAGKKFVERKYTVSEDGKVTLSGTQIIGWDPAAQQITSRLVDSTGGIDNATWTPGQNGWISESNGVTAEGVPTNATNLLTFVDADTISFQSVNRTAGDQTLPDSGKIVLKRVSASE